MSGFRSTKWDPWLIINQIIAIQSIYYFSLGLWIVFITHSTNRSPTLDFIFSYEILDLSNWSGRSLIIVFLLNSVLGAFAIVYIVRRYKQCLDFTTTVHFYHFIACWVYNSHYPDRISWYVVQFLSILVMTIISEHFSKKYELRNIPVGSCVDL